MAGKKKKASRQVASVSVGQLITDSTLGDALVTAVWVFSSSLVNEVAEWIAKHERLSPMSKYLGNSSEFVLSTVLLLVLIHAFGPIFKFFKANINPATSAALITSGKATWYNHLPRMVGPIVGAVLGSIAAVRIIPTEYHSKFHYLSGGLIPGTGLTQGSLVEGGLSAISNLVLILSQDSKSRMLAYWGPLLLIALWCYIGSFFTGPSMNPAVAFGWNLQFPKHKLDEHVVVFWLSPLLGGCLAGVLYKHFLSGNNKAGVKKKKQDKKKTNTTQQVSPSHQAAVSPAEFTIDDVDDFKAEQEASVPVQVNVKAGVTQPNKRNKKGSKQAGAIEGSMTVNVSATETEVVRVVDKVATIQESGNGQASVASDQANTTKSRKRKSKQQSGAQTGAALANGLADHPVSVEAGLQKGVKDKQVPDAGQGQWVTVKPKAGKAKQKNA